MIISWRNIKITVSDKLAPDTNYCSESISPEVHSGLACNCDTLTSMLLKPAPVNLYLNTIVIGIKEALIGIKEFFCGNMHSIYKPSTVYMALYPLPLFRCIATYCFHIYTHCTQITGYLLLGKYIFPAAK